MFLALLINATASYWIRTDDLVNDARNTRVRDEEFGGPRQPILATNTPIVQDVPTGTTPYAYQRQYLDGPLYAGHRLLLLHLRTIRPGAGVQCRTNRPGRLAVHPAHPRHPGRAFAGRRSGRRHHPAEGAAGGLGRLGNQGAAVAIDYQTGAITSWCRPEL